ncbi:MAG: Na+/H+ antiporter NhaA, partial [Candidatus Velamenicoccus archaeovorus]
RVHVRWWAVYVALGVGVWLAFREAGVSGTVAGVVLGLLTPAVPFQRPAAVSREAHRVADETVDDPHPPDADAAAWLYLARLSREAVSPLARMERFLHPWTSYLIVPLFALANAGVTFGGHLPSAATDRAAIGMVIARLVGKTFGITLAAALAVRLGLARLPAGTTWRHLVGAAAAAGVPFTVSLLVADLALSGSTLELAKVGILVAAVVTGTVGFALLRSSDRSPR